ncbi:phosphate ABC transporter substrate-binding protein [Niastella vici]|uniref:Phosphate ABC transporter substrate-binding protein n=1 Tax=Niastella vici TaxID=1703345 RepID=A0A1V9FZR2_9BACT|nr:substrate-binding domain-containing protein [Niastella vici]OQP63859.1 phosphate ABC transporter substrate-binding protein [Niastella vici]
MKLMLIFLLTMFLSCKPNIHYIKIKGSDTEVNLVVRLAEEFHKTNPDFHVSISGGGSGLGIASLLNGQADIANSSRTMNAYENTLFQKSGIEVDTFVFAEDVISFIVSKYLSLDSISIQDLGKILSGEYNNWVTLTGKNLPINIYGRQSNSGTHDFVKQKLAIDFSPYAKEMNGNAQIIEAVKADRSGIGYVGAGYVMEAGKSNQKIKVLKIVTSKNALAQLPSAPEAVIKNSYYFKRPLYQFIKKEAREKAAAFLAFEKSDTGRAIIRSAGYFPVSSH